METQKIRKLVFAAVLAALTCVATLVIQIPVPAVNGYINLGDCIVLLCAWILGPWYGLAAAGIGSMLADLFAGYPAYAPATLVIKAVMALLAAVLYKALGKKNWAFLVCAVAAEAVMVVGYWLYDGFLMGSVMGAAVGIPSNLVQAAFGLIASTALALALKASKYVRDLFPAL